MPNWCDNILTVEGAPDDVRAFVECVKDGDEPLSFERLVPTPPAMTDEDTAKALGRRSVGDSDRRAMPDWYNWRVANWGTKWDACDASLSDYTEGDTNAEYHLNTAWAPPEMWLVTVAKMFPRLRFTLRFVEEGLDYAGYTVFRGAQASSFELTPPSLTQEQLDEGVSFFAHDITVPDNVLPLAAQEVSS